MSKSKKVTKKVFKKTTKTVAKKATKKVAKKATKKVAKRAEPHREIIIDFDDYKPKKRKKKK